MLSFQKDSPVCPLHRLINRLKAHTAAKSKLARHLQAVEAKQLRQEAAAALAALRRGFGPDHMLSRKSQQLFDVQFGGA